MSFEDIQEWESGLGMEQETIASKLRGKLRRGIITTSLIMGTGIAATLPLVEAGQWRSVFAIAIGTAVLGLLSSADILVTWWADLVPVQSARRTIKQAIPSVTFQEQLRRDAQARLN